MGKKPTKPYADFPLFLHKTGQWAKKIRGRMHYFGKDSKAALEKYTAERDDLHAGRTPRLHPDGPSVAELANRFLDAKKSLVRSEELSLRTWSDYYGTCEHLVKTLGKTRKVAELGSTDFERLRSKLAKRRGPVSLGNEIQRVRTIFEFAFEDGLIEKPVRFGATFKKPNRKTIRKARHEAGPRMIEADDLRKLLASADQPLNAMILLAVNCGFGQTDISSLPLSAIDLAAGWIDFPRPKTAVGRRCPLWPETVDAIREAVAIGRKAKLPADAGLAFITKYGARFVRTSQRDKDKPAVPIDMIQNEFQKLLTLAGINRRGLGFYALRHTFRTIADGSKDQVAVNSIMGHTDESMAARYRERIDDGRLREVANVVRNWLFPPPK
ncbi:MAG TPA: tyrosine-type recombinase/integrase [Gemmataceae bacterium]